MNTKTGKKEKAPFSVKEFLSEQELDDTPEKQVFPAVACKLARTVFLHTQTMTTPVTSSFSCNLQRSVSCIFYVSERNSLYIYMCVKITLQ